MESDARDERGIPSATDPATAAAPIKNSRLFMLISQRGISQNIENGLELNKLVETRGIEPLASALRTPRSPS